MENGIFFGRIGTNFGVSFLQTGASLKKARGSEMEHVGDIPRGMTRLGLGVSLVTRRRIGDL